MDRAQVRGEMPGVLMFAAALVLVVGAILTWRQTPPADDPPTTVETVPVAEITDASVRALAASLLAYAAALNAGGEPTREGARAVGQAADVLAEVEAGTIEVVPANPPAVTSTTAPPVTTTAPPLTTTTTRPDNRDRPVIPWPSSTTTTVLVP